MTYQLREGLSFCLIDGHAVFLDIPGDRYFMLPKSLNDEFIAWVDLDAGRHVVSTALLMAGVLADTNSSLNMLATASGNRPTRSLTEEVEIAPRVRVGTYVEVARIVCAMRLQLAIRRLGAVLDALKNQREGMGNADSLVSESMLVQRLRSATAEFSSARRHIPIRMSCLLDSLSLATYLARRGLPAHIVFGVTLAPFSAHCWVQHGDLALNESVDGAVAHHPIMVW